MQQIRNRACYLYLHLNTEFYMHLYLNNFILYASAFKKLPVFYLKTGKSTENGAFSLHKQTQQIVENYHNSFMLQYIDISVLLIHQ